MATLVTASACKLRRCLDLDALQIGSSLSFTPPDNPSSLAWGWYVWPGELSSWQRQDLCLVWLPQRSQLIARLKRHIDGWLCVCL